MSPILGDNRDFSVREKRKENGKRDRVWKVAEPYRAIVKIKNDQSK